MGIVAKIFGVAIIVVIVLALYGWTFQFQTYTYTGMVKDKFIDPGRDGSHYLIRIVDNATGRTKMLEIAKNWFCNQVNEDELYLDIKVNNTYTFKCWGYDIMYFGPFNFYWYPSVIEVTEVIQ